MGLIDVRLQQMLNGIHVLSIKLITLSLPHNYEAQEWFRSFNMDVCPCVTSALQWDEKQSSSHSHYSKLMSQTAIQNLGVINNLTMNSRGEGVTHAHAGETLCKERVI